MGQVVIRDSNYFRASFARYSGATVNTAVGDTVVAVLIMDAADAAVTPAGTTCRIGGSAGGVGGTLMTQVGTDYLYAPGQLFMRAWEAPNFGVAGTTLVEVDVTFTGRNPAILVFSANDVGALTLVSVASSTATGANFSDSAATAIDDLLAWIGRIETNTTALNVVGSGGTTVARQNQLAASENKAVILSKPGAAGTTSVDATFTAYGVSAHQGYKLVLRSSGADTTDPTLTGSITAGASTSTTISYSWPAGSDNVAVSAYERSLDGGTTWLNIGNVLTRTDTGLAPSTAYAVRVRALDAAGNVSTPPLAASISTTAAGDAIVPTLTGVITQGAVTSTTIAYSWPAGSDNIGVSSYERSLDSGATWLDVGNVLTHTDSALPPSTAYPVRVRAKDAAGNVSTPPLALSISTTAAPTFSAQIGPYATAGIAATNVTVHYTMLMGDGPGGFTQVKQGSVLLNGSGVGTVTHTAAGRAYLLYSPVAPAVFDADKHMSYQPVTLA